MGSTPSFHLPLQSREYIVSNSSALPKTHNTVKMSDQSWTPENLLREEISDKISLITDPFSQVCLRYMAHDSQLRLKDDVDKGNPHSMIDCLKRTRTFCHDFRTFELASSSGYVPLATALLGKELESCLTEDSQKRDEYGGYPNTSNLDNMHALKVAVNAYLIETLQDSPSDDELKHR